MAYDDYPNALFRAHILLYCWGSEALADKTAEAGVGSEANPAPAVDGGPVEPTASIIAETGDGTNSGSLPEGDGSEQAPPSPAERESEGL